LAKKVISNIDLNETCFMVEKSLSDDFKSLIGEREVGNSVFTTYVTLEQKIDKSRIKAQHVL